MIRIVPLLLVLCLPGGLAFGQTTPPPRTFEVASIRPHDGPLSYMGSSTSGMTFSATFNAFQLILDAYNMKGYQVTAPPDLPLSDPFYDVAAKAGGDGVPSRDEFRRMLQTLLADRFKLKVHRDTKEISVYALVVGDKGSKLKPSATDAAPMGRSIVSGRNYEITRPKATMDDVVQSITNAFLDRPVVDRTGLTGAYDLKLTYTPDTQANRRGEPGPNDINIFTAVQEQLGLKLEPKKAMVEILVVDHIEKPSDN